MDQRATNTDDSGSGDSSRERAHTPPLSRRDFAARFGAGSTAAVGVAWAAPHISTIKFAAKAAVGSPPPGSTTTSTSTTIAGEQGSLSISNTSPCAGDVVTVTASGFAPKTAVTLEIDSPEHALGVTTAGAGGRIDVTLQLPSSPTGAHHLLVVGVQPGGRTLSLSTPITIKTEAECAVGPQGTTTTSSTPTTQPPTGPTSPTTTTPTTTPTSTVPPVKASGRPQTPAKTSGNGGLLAFTGTDSVDLALLGAAAAVGGRALFGLVAHRDDEEDDEE